MPVCTKIKQTYFALLYSQKASFFRRNTILIGNPFELKVEDGQTLKEAISAGEHRLREEILTLKNTYEDFVMQKKLVKKLKKEK